MTDAPLEWVFNPDREHPYDEYPGHPLYGVPLAVLKAAREVTGEAAIWNDIDADMVEPLADAVVMNLLESGYINTGRSAPAWGDWEWYSVCSIHHPSTSDPECDICRSGSWESERSLAEQREALSDLVNDLEADVGFVDPDVEDEVKGLFRDLGEVWIVPDNPCPHHAGECDCMISSEELDKRFPPITIDLTDEDMP